MSHASSSSDSFISGEIGQGVREIRELGLAPGSKGLRGGWGQTVKKVSIQGLTPICYARQMNVRLASLVLAGLLVLPCTASAQSATDAKRLDPMVGRWRIEVDLKATPISQATKASGTEDCEWFANRHVVCRSDAKGTTGTYSQMRTLSYVPAQRQFAAYTIDSLGTSVMAYGQVTGDTWTFTTSQSALNIRLTLKIAATSYTALVEFAGPDGKYLPLSEVRGTRVK